MKFRQMIDTYTAIGPLQLLGAYLVVTLLLSSSTSFVRGDDGVAKATATLDVTTTSDKKDCSGAVISITAILSTPSREDIRKHLSGIASELGWEPPTDSEIRWYEEGWNETLFLFGSCDTTDTIDPLSHTNCYYSFKAVPLKGVALTNGMLDCCERIHMLLKGFDREEVLDIAGNLHKPNPQDGIRWYRTLPPRPNK